MTRRDKIEALQKVFATGDKSHLKGSDDMVIHSVVIERDGWLQVIAINPTFEIPEHELTLEEFQNWKGSLPLFPDL